MKSWIEALSRTRNAIAGRLSRLFTQEGRGEKEMVAEWEEALVGADVPPRLAMECLERCLRGSGGIPFQERLQDAFVQALSTDGFFDWKFPAKPAVVLIAGVNGSGKTTTAAKLAYRAKQHGLLPLLAAADTFRAAGTDQLKIWADRVECAVVAGHQGADAAAVAYDAVQAGLSRNADVVFIDTAGRMHTKQPLMNELQKVKRSAAKSLAGAPHEIWLVLDATIGNNAVAQAKSFHEAVGVTGLIISKLDGSSKAGAILAVKREIAAPILFVGLGEDMDDLAPFDPGKFVRAMLGIEQHDERTG